MVIFWPQSHLCPKLNPLNTSCPGDTFRVSQLGNVLRFKLLINQHGYTINDYQWYIMLMIYYINDILDQWYKLLDILCQWLYYTSVSINNYGWQTFQTIKKTLTDLPIKYAKVVKPIINHPQFSGLLLDKITDISGMMFTKHPMVNSMTVDSSWHEKSAFD